MAKFPASPSSPLREPEVGMGTHTPISSALGESEAAKPQIQSQSKLQSKLKADLDYITKPCPQNPL